MRKLKHVLGVGCLVLALLPGSLALFGLFSVFHNSPGPQILLPVLCVISIFAVLAVGLIGNGWFLLAKGDLPISQKAKTLIILHLLCLGILVVVVLPNFVRAHSTRAANPCINNLRQIDAAKYEWALEQNKTNGAVCTESDITPYIKLDANGNLPKCPQGGKYTIGRVGEPPTCPLGTTVDPPHVLP